MLAAFNTRAKFARMLFSFTGFQHCHVGREYGRYFAQKPATKLPPHFAECLSSHLLAILRQLLFFDFGIQILTIRFLLYLSAASHYNDEADKSVIMLSRFISHA